MCDRVLLIDRGKLIAQGTVAELVVRSGGQPLMEIRFDGRPPASWSSRLAEKVDLSPASSDKRVVLKLTHLVQVSEVLDYAQAAGARVLDFTVHSPTLSDAFIALTGRPLRDDESDSD